MIEISPDAVEGAGSAVSTPATASVPGNGSEASSQGGKMDVKWGRPRAG